MRSRSGRFAARDISTADVLITDVLGEPGSWCNFWFEPLEDDEAEESALFGFLAARGPSNPMATIMTPGTGRRRGAVEVGIQHRAGTKAASQLREAELSLPQEARVAQDHPRRGLVVEWPENADMATLVAWLFPAMRILGRAPTSGDVIYTWSMVD